MLIRYSLLFSLFILSLNSWATKEAVFWGGGADAAGPTTIFDGMYQGFMANMKAAGWNTQTAFDGGHSTSEDMAKQLSNNTNKDMTSANVMKIINDLKTRIANGSLKSGDSLMIAIGAHGRPRYGEDTHGIDTNDGFVSLDKLADIKALAEKKGIKLAILDMSCYSGNSQFLGSDKTCVVSASNGETVGYNNTGIVMMNNLVKGNTVEQAFLNMRNDPIGGAAATPMISTDAGKKASEATSFLSQEMIIGGDKLSEHACDSVDQQRLDKLTSDMKAISAGNLSKELQQAIASYTKYRVAAVKMFDDLMKADQTCITLNGKNVCSSYKNFIALQSFLTSKSKSAPLNASEQEQLKQIQIVLSSVDYQKYTQDYAKYKQQLEGVKKEAIAVGDIERKIYKKIYDRQSAISKAPNPCKDFVL